MADALDEVTYEAGEMDGTAEKIPAGGAGRTAGRGADAAAGIKRPCGALRLRCCRKTPQGVPTEKARRLASLNKTV